LECAVRARFNERQRLSRAYTRHMSKVLSALWSAALITFASNLLYPIDARGAEANRAPYIDLTASFSRFVDETAGMEETARVALFRKQMDALLPGFYAPRFGATTAQYDAIVARALEGFADLRPRYEQVQKDFPAAFDAGIQHFRKEFPGFTPNVPVYLLHSLGEMDGGTRELGDKAYLIFGADVIAQIHEAHELTAFLDHELFHVENGKYFADCDQVWCPLWAEGLATYAAKVMNPDADDRQLLLTFPKPIRAEVDAGWPAALCFTRARLFSAESADMAALFVGGAGGKDFPQRFGYYVGLRVVEELGGRYELSALARMPPKRAKAALTASVDRLIQQAGGCNRAAGAGRK
jgi:hypothetical protein